jgi:hypothetical protein
LSGKPKKRASSICYEGRFSEKFSWILGGWLGRHIEVTLLMDNTDKIRIVDEYIVVK